MAKAQVFVPFSFWKTLDPLTVVPASPIYLQTEENLTLTASGSSGSYNWSITPAAITDNATITTPGITADYQARSTAYTTDTITVNSNSTLNLNVTTYNPISITPVNVTIAISSSQDFTVAGGLCVTSPATQCIDSTANWAVTSGGASGSIDGNGLFTATATPGPVTVEVSDLIGNTVTTNVTVSNTLQISPQTLKLSVYSTNLFTSILGTQPYSYTVFSGTGSIGCQSTLTGTHNTSTVTLNVTSTSGCPPVGVIRVGSEDICYRSITGTTFNNCTRGCNSSLAASYTAGQTYNFDRAVYTAPTMIGAATVRNTDAGLATSDAAVSIIRPVDIQVGQYFSCAVFDEGSIKCWGWNGNGQLGQGNASAIGDSSLEVGGANPFVDLGTGRTVNQISLGAAHACAILDNDLVKCWGNGSNGRLGYGNTSSRGDGLNEMGDNLPYVDLGAGRTAIALALGGTHTCAILDNNLVKCWGNGANGRLGYGNTSSRGDGLNEMGDNLPYVDLGTGRTASKIVAGLDYTCVILDNSAVKCWGRNQRGQLGKDSLSDLGDGINEMGDFLTNINIGAGRTATDIISLYETVCIHRDDSSAICWGRNNVGQVGKGSTAGANANIGDASGEMAAILPINFGAGFGTLSKLFSLGRAVCAKDTVNATKCWGYNAFGQLLRANTTNQTAPPAAVMDFGTGLVPFKIKSYLDAVCVLFTNDQVKCFGRARTGTVGQVHGVLLNGSVENSLGDAATEVGDSLQFTNL